MNQPPRVILHVFPSTSWGGAEIYSVQLASAQQKSGQKVFFWTSANTQMAEEAAKQGLTVLTEKLGNRIDISFLRLRQMLKKTQATHVHLHWSGGMWSLGLLKLFCKFKLIYHVHLWMKHSKKDPLHALLYRNIDSIVVAGEKAKEAVAKCLPVNPEKIKMCPYALQDETTVKPLTKENLGFKANHFLVGVFSRIDRQKGIMEFLKAMSKLKKEFSDVRILIVGEPTRGEEDSKNYEVELKAYAKENFSRDVIHFEGFKKNFRDYLAACDVLVVPSYHESYSLIILEAFALGVPVLSTSAGGTPDLVRNERGWLVEPQNVESLTEGLRLVFSKPHQAPVMGLMAQDYVKKNHSFDQVLRCLDEVYDGRS